MIVMSQVSTFLEEKYIAYQIDPETFEINWNDVKKLISTKTKMVIINTPHNPSAENIV